jgi:Tfp pilus assembly protein PilX
MSHRNPKAETVRRARRRSEAGSAYLIALMALVVLTIVGLSLALITQTEMQIGANEKSIERSFYAADSGIALATARTLVTRRPAWSEVYTIQDPAGYGLRLEHEVDVSPFFPIGVAPCNLCDVNNAGEYGSTNYHRANHAVTAVAIRHVPGSTKPISERALTAMVEFQPWTLPPEAVLAIQDPSQLAKIKF